jgi:hypothetical protein
LSRRAADFDKSLRLRVSHSCQKSTRSAIARRGPLVYAVEGVDHGGAVPSTATLAWGRLDLVVPDDARPDVEPRPDLLGGVTVITGGVRDASGRARRLTAIPYYAVAPRTG